MSSVEIRGLKQTQERLEKLVKDLDGPPMVQAMKRATLMVQRDAKKLVHVDRGLTRASIVPSVTSPRFNVIEGVVGSNRISAAVLETGSKPHYAPFEEILRWVVRKRLATGKAALNVARRVWLKIARRGTNAYPWLRPAFEQNIRAIIDEFQRTVRRLCQ